ncbi:MAG TPA: chemotaxis protein CheB [Candidatus Binatia bacterium]|nr:chemotaxis protein CheB [Candidatus Binatia bacterium]
MPRNKHEDTNQNGETPHERRRDNGHGRRASGFAVIVLATSAGGIKALIHILSTLPADFPVPIAVTQHRS